MEEELFLKELFGEENEKAAEEENSGKEEKEDPEKKKAIEDFAKFFGENPEDVEEIFRKGKEFDELSEKFGKAKGDSEIFEKLADIRGISKDEMKNEILWALEKATAEKMTGEILAANPGMNRETAKELANFRLEVKKAKQEIPEESAAEAMLSELEKFLSAHSGEGIRKLSGKVVEEWEGGIPLETAFEKHRLFKENEKLLEEIEKMKHENLIAAQRAYAKEHSPGSLASAAGIIGPDEFAAELFKEY